MNVNDVGTILELTVKENGAVVDLSSQTALSIFLKKPSGTTASKTGTLTTDGTDGKFRYTTLTGDIDETGTWTLQGKVVISAGTFYTSLATLNVAGNL